MKVVDKSSEENKYGLHQLRNNSCKLNPATMIGWGRQQQQRWENLHLLDPPLVVLLPQPLGHVVPVPVDRLGQLLLLVLDPPLDHLHISLPIALISFFVNQNRFHWKTNLSNWSKTVLSLVQFLETTLLTTISLRKDQCRLNLSNSKSCWTTSNIQTMPTQCRLHLSNTFSLLTTSNRSFAFPSIWSWGGGGSGFFKESLQVNPKQGFWKEPGNASMIVVLTLMCFCNNCWICKLGFHICWMFGVFEFLILFLMILNTSSILVVGSCVPKNVASYLQAFCDIRNRFFCLIW